jgi:tetrahydromethanopterin S-methyltransferase subunit D
MNDKLKLALGAAVAALAGLLFLTFIFVFPVYWLWNHCLVGTVEGFHPLSSFWHAWGISILFSFLFKSTNSK